MTRPTLALLCLLSALGVGLACRVRSVADIACADDSHCPSGSHCEDRFCAPGPREPPLPSDDPCAAVSPTDPGSGVFVSAGASGDGTQQSPLGTVSAGLAAAAASGKRRVFVAQGTYDESLVIPDSPAGLYVMGGWDPSTWRRSCNVGLDYDPSTTVIHSSTGSGVTLVDLGKESGLEWVKVEVEPAAASLSGQSGKSTCGIRVQNSRVVLRKVMAVAGAAGQGGSPEALADRPLENPPGCGDGRLGSNGAGAPAASPGSFAESAQGPLFRPGDGNDGEPGGNGQNGDAGYGPTLACSSCQEACDGGTNCDCVATAGASIQGAPGTCGLGGCGGAGGTRGFGGGSSIALLASGSSTVVALKDVLLRAGAAGSGSAALSGQGGLGGAPGAAGAPVSCTEVTSCARTGATCQDTSRTNTSQGSGGTGGSGGRGGDGSGGAGGWSCAAASLGGAQLVDSEGEIIEQSGWVQLEHSTPGVGRQGAPNGVAAPHCFP